MAGNDGGFSLESSFVKQWVGETTGETTRCLAMTADNSPFFAFEQHKVQAD
jgi:hypothetical protein